MELKQHSPVPVKLIDVFRLGKNLPPAALIGCLLWSGPVLGEAIPTINPDREHRIVAVGDVHGDLPALRRILRKSGIIDDSDRWAAGKSYLVQTGDLLDRGPDDRAVMDLFQQLEKEAPRTGGKVFVLLGNHEVMNLMGDLRYVSEESYQSFSDSNSDHRQLKAYGDYLDLIKHRARLANKPEPVLSNQQRDQWFKAHTLGFVEHREAFEPRGRYGSWLRKKDPMVKLDDSIFLHGGLTAELELSLKDINKRVRQEITAFDHFRRYLLGERRILSFFTLEEIVQAVFEEIEWLEAIPTTDGRLSGEQTRHLEILKQFHPETWLSTHPSGPLWFRGFADWDSKEGSHSLDILQERYGVKRFVVGHTPQLRRGIRSRFDARVILIDTGMLSTYYKGGMPSALEIRNDVLKAIYPTRTVVIDEGQVEP